MNRTREDFSRVAVRGRGGERRGEGGGREKGAGRVPARSRAELKDGD